MTTTRGLAHAVVLVAFSFLFAPLATGRLPPLPKLLCKDQIAGNYTQGSAYQANIGRLAATLRDSMYNSSSLFATGVQGTAPDLVYALALCRGDTKDTMLCASCVNSAYQSLQKLCGSRVAVMFDDECTFCYANWDFLSNNTDNWESYALWNTHKDSGTTPEFDAASGGLVNATAEYAAADPLRRFGTGEEPSFNKTYPMIYSLAQCTPDMSAVDCRACLAHIMRLWATYFTGRCGARAFSVRCNFRFETYPFSIGGSLLQLPGPPGPPQANNRTHQVVSEKNNTGQGTTTQRARRVLSIAVPLAAAAVLAPALACYYFRKRRKQSKKTSDLLSSTTPDAIQTVDSLLLDLSTLRVATDNFAESNKLGEGGFGAVYKGVLSDGQEIAVKRLSLGSRQGVQELKTELVLVAKLQHKNLVRLIGVCLEEDEKLLVYEYMPNRSLDTILFDSQKSKELDWGKRLKIITGVVRGLQYLHEESQLKIVHRDLKPSNVLLDSDYNPKISDFGLAKLVDRDQSRGITHRIAGTYGYMAPEYAMRGQYSVKSDVFSLGVLILEIITRRKNNSSLPNFEESVDLLSLVWEHWSLGKTEEMLDPFLVRHAPQDQMVRLVDIGLLCVQDNPLNRPAVSSVNVMLSSESISLRAPSRPAFYIQEVEADFDGHSDARTWSFQSTRKSKATASPNEMSFTELETR